MVYLRTMNSPYSLNNTKPDPGNRFGSLAIDYLFCAFLSGILAIPFIITLFTQSFQNTINSGTPDIFFENFFIYWWLVMVIGHAIYLSKDIVNGRSAAKRIFKLQVLDSKTGQVASPMKCFIRNIPTILWIVELIMALVNTERRLGDMMASTKLARFTPEAVPQPAFKFHRIILPFLAALALTALLYGLAMLPFLAIRHLLH